MSAAGSAARSAPTTAPRQRPQGERPQAPKRDAQVHQFRARPSTTAPAPTSAAGSARRAGIGGFAALIVGLLASGLFALLLLNTTLGEGSFRIKAMQLSLSQLTDQQQQLQRQVALADSPLTLAARARALGMVPSATPVFLRLSDGRILGVPVAATAPPVVVAPVVKPTVAPSARATAAAKPTATATAKPAASAAAKPTTTAKPTATTKPKH